MTRNQVRPDFGKEMIWSAGDDTFCLPAAFLASPVRAESSLPPVLRQVGFGQRLNEQVPLDLVFQDESGRTVKLGDFFNGKPVGMIFVGGGAATCTVNSQIAFTCDESVV